jgi:hypothetical protein
MITRNRWILTFAAMAVTLAGSNSYAVDSASPRTHKPTIEATRKSQRQHPRRTKVNSHLNKQNERIQTAVK